jgi:hypothetical protein
VSRMRIAWWKDLWDRKDCTTAVGGWRVRHRLSGVRWNSFGFEVLWRYSVEETEWSWSLCRTAVHCLLFTKCCSVDGGDDVDGVLLALSFIVDMIDWQLDSSRD